MKTVESPRDIKSGDIGLREPLKPVITEGENGRRHLEFRIGPLSVRVDDIPSVTMSATEWDLVQAARGSYINMWGGNHYQRVEHDPFDFPDPNSPIKTRHQISFVKLSGEGNPKIYTNRQIDFSASLLSDPKIDVPDDIAFWNISYGATGKQESFRQMLAKRIDKDSLITVISRSGTLPISTDEKLEIQKEKAGISFAAIQLLVLKSNPELIICQLCDEFPSKVLNIKTPEGSIELDFSPTEKVFYFPDDPITMSLNLKNPDAVKHQLKFPGYWVNNDKAREFLLSVLYSGKLKPEDLQSPYYDLLEAIRTSRESEKALKQLANLELIDPINNDPKFLVPSLSEEEKLKQAERFLKLISYSRYLKYMIPLINTEGNINDRLTGDEFRDAFIRNSGVGPFSSTLIPEEWAKSSQRLLDAAKTKYETA